MRSDLSFHAKPDDRSCLVVDLQCGNASTPPRIIVAGDVDGTNATQLHAAVIDVLRHQRPGCIDVDLDQVSSLDAAGIRTMLLCQADARQVDCHLKLVKPQPMVYRVLQITGLLEHFGLDKPRTTPSQPWTATPAPDAASVSLLN
jgi:anti-anti-sigma factor